MNLTDQTYRLATRPASCLLLSYHYGPSSGPAIILAAVFGYGLPLVSRRRAVLSRGPYRAATSKPERKSNDDP